MRRKSFLLLLMLISTNLSSCKQSNKTKHIKTSQGGNLKTDNTSEREKRSIDDEEDKPFWANRGKKQSEEDDFAPNRLVTQHKSSHLRTSDKIEKEPFWGNRGRRDSSEEVDDYRFSESKAFGKLKLCAHCKNNKKLALKDFYEASKESTEELKPFWGNRGRRDSDEDTSDLSPFWGSRGRRQEEDPFWGNRGRRDELPFWGNRGRRENFFWNNRESWGHRRREEDNPFFGNRGRRYEVEPFWSNRDRRDLKDSVETLSSVKDDTKNLYKTKHNWNKFGRESSLKHLFNGSPRDRLGLMRTTSDIFGADTMHDDRIFVEQPHFILVERSSRSSNEDDPYFISRGKKHSESDWAKVARDRRNTIEDIFNSVKSDPYFIARGKKNGVNINNFTLSYENFDKAKELVCSTMDLIVSKNKGTKKSIDDSDRGRRAVLQKLAAQLQSDPYFVSRGKKDAAYDESILEFMSELSELCY